MTVMQRGEIESLTIGYLDQNLTCHEIRNRPLAGSDFGIAEREIKVIRPNEQQTTRFQWTKEIP